MGRGKPGGRKLMQDDSILNQEELNGKLRRAMYAHDHAGQRAGR